MKTKTYIFSIQTNRVGSKCEDEITLQFDESDTDEIIEEEVEEAYKTWLRENNYGGWCEKK